MAQVLVPLAFAMALALAVVGLNTVAGVLGSRRLRRRAEDLAGHLGFEVVDHGTTYHSKGREKVRVHGEVEGWPCDIIVGWDSKPLPHHYEIQVRYPEPPEHFPVVEWPTFDDTITPEHLRTGDLDFDDKFFVRDGTPENVEAILTRDVREMLRKSTAGAVFLTFSRFGLHTRHAGAPDPKELRYQLEMRVWKLRALQR